jgi:hypothetical protein
MDARASLRPLTKHASILLTGGFMESNLDRYKKDLSSLITRGLALFLALQKECHPEDFRRAMKKAHGAKAEAIIRELPSFSDKYQAWYSETLAVVKQVLPDRLADFVRHYEKPKARKQIDFESYRIEDCLQGLTVKRPPFDEVIAGPAAAIPHVRQQLAILESVKARFESSLFDIRRLNGRSRFGNSNRGLQ